MDYKQILINVRCCADRYCANCSLKGEANCKETLLSYVWNEMYNLHDENEKLKSRSNGSFITRLIEQAKTEGRKELAERLKTISRKSYRYDYKLNETIIRGIIYDDEIDGVLKEMEGVQ